MNNVRSLFPAAVANGLAPDRRIPARPLSTDGDDMLFFVPLHSPQATAAAEARRAHEATHARRRAEYETLFRDNLQDVTPAGVGEYHINEREWAARGVPSEPVDPKPLRRFACYELGGGPADRLGPVLTKQGVFTAGGVVLLLAAGWLGGVLSVLAVL